MLLLLGMSVQGCQEETEMQVPYKTDFLKRFSQSFQSLSRVRLFVTPRTAVRQASLSITNSRGLPKFMSIELAMPSSHLIFCRPLLLLPSIPPSIRVFSNESAFRVRWPMYWSFSFSISPSSEHAGLISSRMDWWDLLAVQGKLRRRVNNGKARMDQQCPRNLNWLEHKLASALEFTKLLWVHSLA